MSGRRITDFGGYPHTSDMAMKSKNSLKHYESASSAGAVSQYQDTTEAIKSSQNMGDSKVKSHGMKPGYRQ